MIFHERIAHDAAHATTLTILQCLESCIRPEEHVTAYEEIFQRVKAGIEAYVLHSQRQQEQLNPLSNQTPAAG